MEVFSARGNGLEHASCRPLFGLLMAIRWGNHCYNYPPCTFDYLHAFAWFKRGE